MKAVPSRQIRLLLVDDSQLVRQGIRSVIDHHQGEPSIVVVGEAASVQETLVVAAACKPDIVLLDLRLPDMSDLSLLATIRQLLPETPVVLMTAFGTPELLAQARQLGVMGVLNKPFELADLSRMVMRA